MACDCRCYIPIPGPAGPSGAGGVGCCVLERVTAHAVSAFRLVVPTDVGTVEYADATDIAHVNRPIWLSVNAWGSGVVATLHSGGLVVEPGWAWVPGMPLLVGLAGVVVQTQPPTGVFLRRIGDVVSPTTIDFRPNQPVVL